MTPPTAAEHAGPGPEHQNAFTDFYASHYARVLAYARRRSADEATARDITAETFTTAWRRLPEALSGGLPWLYTTAGLHLRNHQRVSGRAFATAARLAAEPTSPLAEALDPFEGYADADLVRRAVRQLPEHDRELLMLTLWEHLDVATAAEVVGCSTGAAHVRLHRARSRLRSLLTTDPQHGTPTPPHGRSVDRESPHR